MAHQGTFAELVRSRTTDPATSKTAARKAGGLAADHRVRIVGVMRKGGDWTATEIAERIGLTAVQVCRRFKELVNEGRIFANGQTRPTPSGRPSQCYEACR